MGDWLGWGERVEVVCGGDAGDTDNDDAGSFDCGAVDDIVIGLDTVGLECEV